MIILLKGSLQFLILDMKFAFYRLSKSICQPGKKKKVEDKQLIIPLLEIDFYTQGKWIAGID